MTLCSRLQSEAAHAGLADFGMCLISPPLSCAWEMTVAAGTVEAEVDMAEAMTALDAELEEAAIDVAVAPCVVQTAVGVVARDCCDDSGGL